MNKIITAAMLALTAPLCSFAQDDASGAAKSPERKVAVQTYSIRNASLEEGLEQLASIGIKYVQVFPGNKLRKDEEDKAKVNPATMTDEDKAFLKEILAKNNIQMIDFGVITPKHAKEVHKIFEFAKEFNLPSITTEANPKLLATFNKLGAEYKIKTNIHNHTTKDKGPYGDPKFAMETIKDMEWVFAEPDDGHWVRSGLDPVESLKILKGKINNIHFKDVTKSEEPMKATSCQLGKGCIDLKAILAELDAQGFDGYFILEFDGKPSKKTLGMIKASADWLNPKAKAKGKGKGGKGKGKKAHKAEAPAAE